MSLINAKACDGAFTEKQQHRVAARLTAVIVALEGFVSHDNRRDETTAADPQHHPAPAGPAALIAVPYPG
jgi:hypothetical protein